MRIYAVERGVVKDKRKITPRKKNGKIIGYMISIPPFVQLQQYHQREANITYIVENNKIIIQIEFGDKNEIN